MRLINIWKIIILIVGASILDGCGAKAEDNEKFIEVQKIGVSKSKDESKAALLETEKNELSVNVNANEMLVIEISDHDTVEAKVGSQEAYEKFIDQLNEYKEYTTLHLDLLGENTVIYLDEILSQHNFSYLSISNGGIISLKDTETFSDTLLKNLELKYIFQIGNFEMERLTALKFITIWLDNQLEITNDFAEILRNTSCENIIILWDDKENFLEKNILKLYAEDFNYGEEGAYFRAFYKLNDKNFSYVSYEFYNKEPAHEPHVFICIKNEVEKYFDFFEIPQEMLSVTSGLYGDGQRIHLEDINFDGYKDIIFLGYNDGLELYHECIGFLWNQSKQRFEPEETVPVYFDYIDTERERLIFTSSLSAFNDSYYIYEYINGAFEEKKLDVTFNLNEADSEEITWEYYENGIFLEKLVLNYNKDGSGHYIFYDRNGSTLEEVLPKEKTYSELGKQYFAEFDFYNHG